jgi:uncharacterized membrane protein YoaK (UPF0700 family)
MTQRSWIAALLSFNGGFVDTAGFLGLHGLFTAHVTGNFVTLGAALAFGTQGVLSKMLALPEFVLVIAVVRLTETALRLRDVPAMRALLVIRVLFLFAFFPARGDARAVRGWRRACRAPHGFCRHCRYGHPECGAAHPSRHPAALDAHDRQHGQATLDVVDILSGLDGEAGATARARLRRLLTAIGCLAAGCGSAALLYTWIGFWALTVPVAVGAATAILNVWEAG